MLKDEDYATLLNWWSANDFPAPPKEFLPEEGRGGIMVYKDNIEICSGYLFFTNSKIAWLEFVVANNLYREKDRKEAIRFLISELTQIAKRKGFKAIFTSINHPSLIKHYEACGYLKGNNNTTEMIIKL